MASTVVEIDTRMTTVLRLDTDVRQRCNPRILDKKAQNLRRWEHAVNAEHHQRLGLVAQTAVLRACPDAISTLLDERGSVLTAAKVLVLARLIHGKLTKSIACPHYLARLKSRLAQLRTRLLRRVEKRMKHFGTSKEVTEEAMLAYALVTSSNSQVVLLHYYHLRQSAIAESLSAANPEGVMRAAEILVKTIQQAPTLAPWSLSSREAPMLPSITCPELNLDLHSQWLGDDIQGFVPYLRQDVMSRAAVKQCLLDWNEKNSQIMLDGVSAALETSSGLKQWISLRRDLLSYWLRVENKHIWLSLRRIFQQAAIKILQKQWKCLLEIPARVQHLLSAGSSTSAGLWTDTILSGAGDRNFRRQVLETYMGKDAALREVEILFQPCLEQIRTSQQAIEQMRKEDWRNFPVSFDDDLDIYQVQLAKNDAEELDKTVQQTRADTLMELNQRFAGMVPKGIETKHVQLCLLFRVWRMLRSHFPPDDRRLQQDEEHIRKLRTCMGHQVLRKPLELCKDRYQQTLGKEDYKIPQLWEGDPPLPILPSAWLHSFFMDACKTMYDQGTDLWTPEMVKMVKSEAGQELQVILIPPEAHEAKTVQLLFDVHYLQHALGNQYGETLREDLSGLVSVDTERIKSNASACWKRTRILFGLFA